MVTISVIILLASLLFMGNYRFHKLNEKVTLFEDGPDREYWDNSRMHEDIFLNQN